MLFCVVCTHFHPKICPGGLFLGGRFGAYLARCLDFPCFSASVALFFTTRYTLGDEFCLLEHIFLVVLGHFWLDVRIPRAFLRRLHRFSSKKSILDDFGAKKKKEGLPAAKVDGRKKNGHRGVLLQSPYELFCFFYLPDSLFICLELLVREKKQAFSAPERLRHLVGFRRIAPSRAERPKPCSEARASQGEGLLWWRPSSDRSPTTQT